MDLEQLLLLITTIDSLRTLREVRSTIQLHSEMQDLAEDSIANRAILNLTDADSALAVTQAYRSSADLSLVFRQKRCVVATNAMLRLLGIDGIDAPQSPMNELMKLSQARRRRNWTAPDGKAYALTVTRVGDFRVVQLAPAATDVGLTPRQIEIMKLVGSGNSSKEIAQQLGCSLFTVRAHLRMVCRRLKVSGRLEALAALRAKGVPL